MSVLSPAFRKKEEDKVFLHAPGGPQVPLT